MTIKELGHVVLYVSDIEKLADFYKNTLGFREIHRGKGVALFSSGRTHHEMLLIEIGGIPNLQTSYPKLGLYHIGFKVADSHEELKTVYEELEEKHVRILGLADHGVTHSIYIKDPDGNELELYADVSDDWKTNPEAILSPTKQLEIY